MTTIAIVVDNNPTTINTNSPTSPFMSMTTITTSSESSLHHHNQRQHHRLTTNKLDPKSPTPHNRHHLVVVAAATIIAITTTPIFNHHHNQHSFANLSIRNYHDTNTSPLPLEPPRPQRHHLYHHHRNRSPHSSQPKGLPTIKVPSFTPSMSPPKVMNYRSAHKAPTTTTRSTTLAKNSNYTINKNHPKSPATPK